MSVYVRRPAKHVDPADVTCFYLRKDNLKFVSIKIEYQGCLHIDNISSSTPVRALTIDQIKQNVLRFDFSFETLKINFIFLLFVQSIEAGFLGKKVEENDTCKEANPFDNNQFAKSDVSITQWTNVCCF